MATILVSLVVLVVVGTVTGWQGESRRARFARENREACRRQ